MTRQQGARRQTRDGARGACFFMHRLMDYLFYPIKITSVSWATDTDRISICRQSRVSLFFAYYLLIICLLFAGSRAGRAAPPRRARPRAIRGSSKASGSSSATSSLSARAVPIPIGSHARPTPHGPHARRCLCVTRVTCVVSLINTRSAFTRGPASSL